MRGCAVLGAVFALAIACVASAQAPEGWAYDVANEWMSPFCPGRTLSDCPSPQADQLRLWIQIQEAAGRTRPDVEAEILERFGDIVLPAPRASGFGVTAYAIPIAAFLAGGVLVAMLLRRWTRVPAPAASSGPIDPDLERAIDEELAR